MYTFAVMFAVVNSSMVKSKEAPYSPQTRDDTRGNSRRLDNDSRGSPRRLEDGPRDYSQGSPRKVEEDPRGGLRRDDQVFYED